MTAESDPQAEGCSSSAELSCALLSGQVLSTTRRVDAKIEVPTQQDEGASEAILNKP